MLRRQISLTLLLALLALWAPGCGDSGGTDGGGGSSSAVGGGDSPEDVIAKAKVMVENKDFGGMVNLIAPDERPLMSVGMLMFSQMAPMLTGGLSGLGGEEGQAEMAKKMKPFEDAMKGIMVKHGTDKLDLSTAMGALQSGSPEDASKWITEQVPDLDHGAFVGDVLGAVAKLGDEASDKASGNFEELGGELTDLEIKGDTATAKINGKPGEFRKVDGRWYISIKGKM